ncbi:LytTR family DNA-binding domain-containing protein [Rheinheimera sp.]|jgi:two-component system LytT family response regulator|uniref:LytTR family DNA-binding domain-containing protein n=1 Tax=Rheinheimera TaxID=67575 RepID=UPI0037C61F36|tara:strand:- start:58 stop:834 length:777 start_codon:yes stop_codon:yes gene_type:complete
MKKQLYREWRVSLLGWSGVIIFLTFIDKLYDLWVPDEHELNNHPLWALQEWGLWYLLTPVLFRLLSQSVDVSSPINRHHVLICSVIVLNGLIYQAIFDFFIFKDSIAYTLLYFAPLHPVVVFINLFIWYRYVALPQESVDQREDIELCTQGLTIEQSNGAVMVPYEDISHINSASNYVEIFTAERAWLKRATLKDIEITLPRDMFIRTHRAHLVNIKLIERIALKASGSGHVVLKSGQIIALSKAHKQAVKACLQNAA